jgi:nucleotide-binding universal stress UspA family protein
MSIFPTKILLATDGSREANLAARTAVDLADKTGSELHVAFILRTQDTSEYDPMGFNTEQAHEEEIKQMGQRLLNEQVRRVEEAGGTVAGAHFRMARPDQGILAVGGGYRYRTDSAGKPRSRWSKARSDGKRL